MKLIRRCISSIKNNWKVILFVLVYIVCFFIIIPLSLGLFDIIRKGDFTLYSAFFICLASTSALSLIAKPLLLLIFKEGAEKISKKLSFAFIPVGCFISISAMASYIAFIPLPFSDKTEFDLALSIFAVPLYLAGLILLGLFIILISFMACVLLRFVMKHTKIVTAIFIVSLIVSLVIR